MQKIKKYKYLLILLSFVVSLIFINFSNDGKIKRDITSGFIELFSISNIEIIDLITYISKSNNIDLDQIIE